MLKAFVLAGALFAGAVAAISRADTHVVTGALGNTRETKAATLAYISLTPSGDLLAVDSTSDVLRVISPDDKLRKKIPVPFTPHAAVALDDGTFVVTGPARVAILDGTGKEIAGRKLPDVGGHSALYARTPGLAVTKDYIFVASQVTTGFTVLRYDRAFQGQKEITKNLRGCCGIMDVATDGKSLLIAENALHHVLTYDLDGKLQSEFGTYNTQSLEGFGGCCEPKNIFPTADGGLYTSESENCRIKYYAPNGACTLIGYGARNSGCTKVSIAVTPDGDKVYFLDSAEDVIRVLTRKK